MRPFGFVVASLILVASPTLSADDAESGRSQTELEKQFEEMMQDARLSGKFTIWGPDGESAPQQDLYMVSDLSKAEGDRWIFTTRMSYGDREVAIPVPCDVKWAGETPVITLTNQEIPNLGTFTARVMIYEGFYAGTWQHGPVGGHMWGRIEKEDE